jgi:hypothetical protein
MRTRLLVAATLVLVLMPAAAVQAGRPVTIRTSFVASDAFPREVCGYPLGFEVEGDTAFRLWLDDEGEPVRAMSTGPIRIRFTRTDTGESARFAIAGPSFYDASLDLVRGTGRWFAMSAEGHPVIASGNWRFPDGTPEGVGAVVDVCDRLA